MSEAELQTDDRSLSPAAGQVESTASGVASVAQATPPPMPAAVGFQSLDRRIISAERTANWIFFAIVAVGGLVAQAIYWGLNWPLDATSGLISGASAIVYGVVLVFLVWAGHFYPVLAYRQAAWRLDEQGLELRRGVWWKHEITIPRARVQHTDVHQGPLMRKFGLARLVINTAGTHNASIAIDGLSFETAQRLRSELVADCDIQSATREMR